MLRNPEPVVEARRQRVFEAWAAGKHQAQIAAAEKITQSQVSRDLAAALAQMNPPGGWKKSKKLRAQLLSQLGYVESELLAAWHRSRNPKERRKGKEVTPGDTKGNGKTEAEKTVEGRDGNPAFLTELRKFWEFKAKLLVLVHDDLQEELGNLLAELERRSRERGFDI